MSIDEVIYDLSRGSAGREPIIQWRILRPGSHLVEFGNFTVPIRVEENDSVRVFVDKAEGTGDAIFCAVNDLEVKFSGKEFAEAVIKPRVREHILEINDFEARIGLCIKRQRNLKPSQKER